MADIVAPAHSGYVACRGGDAFFAMADIAYDPTSGRWEQGTLELLGRFRLADGSTVDHAYPMPAGPTWQSWGAVFAAPEQASGVLFLLRRVADPSDATVYVTNLQLRRQVDDVVIKDGAIQARHISADTVLAVHIAAHSITADEIAAGTITATEIGDQAITEAKLRDAVITSAKIADLSVNTIHIAGQAVSVSNYFQLPGKTANNTRNLDLSDTPFTVAPAAGSALHFLICAFYNSANTGADCQPSLELWMSDPGDGSGDLRVINRTISRVHDTAQGTATLATTVSAADRGNNTGPFSFYLMMHELNAGNSSLSLTNISVLVQELKK